ncbi:hypothetical protein FB562_1312 [Homoserinimonas aerilata]|uniref:Amino acid deaminase n=1 Tax=Homoserinimonas aerilata TaxID=1162970 RepID=A0A542YJC8_9MICO|nr:amino acid deaminase [Homoserinimonas aerilata]TQL48225.1 hypothetical protein FB562_1312 [Homoserinimonas aerilata]
MTQSTQPAPAPTAAERAEIARCITADARAGRFAAWGYSTVVDEVVGHAVVPEPLFAELNDLAGLDARYPVGNAGLLHVYGYWFALEPTPFGFKRDRWVDGRLARTFGLDSAAFRLGSDPDATPLQRVAEAAYPVLLDPPSDAVGVAEAVVEGMLSRVVLVRAPGASSTALVYGLDTGDGLRLITVFPVAGDTAELLHDFSAEPRLRWNAASALKS